MVLLESSSDRFVSIVEAFISEGLGFVEFFPVSGMEGFGRESAIQLSVRIEDGDGVDHFGFLALGLALSARVGLFFLFVATISSSDAWTF